MWTNGPSLPILRPAALAAISPATLAEKVERLKYLLIWTPARIDFTSGIPEPSASLLINFPVEAAKTPKNSENRTQMMKFPIKLSEDDK